MKKLFTLVFAISVFSFTSISQDAGMNITGSAKLTLATGTYLLLDGDLKISVTDGLLIPPETYVTVGGDMSLDARKAITVQTDTTGVLGTPRGSLIFNGSSVSHTNKGSIEVQSYITGSAGTNYFMHFVGAPVEDTTVGWSGLVRLQQFDMTYLDTYAFEWDATVDTTSDQPWVNVWPYWYPVPVGNGLTLSNYIAGRDTIIMEGYPVTGSVSYTIRNVVNNGLELISNPFPSSIDFDQFANDNSAYIQNKYYIYNAAGGNWIVRNSGIGGDQYIQYGQGFFVFTSSNGNISFTNSHKKHSNAPFREFIPNLLTIKVDGGSIGFKDETYICFAHGASKGFDEEIDAKKWNSVSAGATMINTLADDNTRLAINNLPIEGLNSQLTTVPLHFVCGEEAEYTLSFEGIDTFDQYNEVWLEDIQAQTDWMSITNSDNLYSFFSSPGDEVHRFNIHFFGPTVIDDPVLGEDDGLVKIFSSKEYAYVVNTSDERIKEVMIYDIMGQQVLRKAVPGQNTLNFYVSDKTGYYVVRVLTDKQVHTKKILILK
jgi:hypothetical protein